MPSSCICPSVCVGVSVTLRYYVKTAKRRITQCHTIAIFCSCRISTDKHVARSLCDSRATCMSCNVISKSIVVRMTIAVFNLPTMETIINHRLKYRSRYNHMCQNEITFGFRHHLEFWDEGITSEGWRWNR